MEWQVEYYQKENGKIPVLEYLLTLQPKLRAKVFSEIELLEKHGYTVHGFTKKTEKTPQAELDRAVRYKEDYERRCGNA